MKKNNKKGFTLVELLAVIVILAVVVLIAMTAVVPKMNEAQKNSFVTEVNKFVQGAQTLYTSLSINGDFTSVPTLSANGGTVTLQELVSAGAIEKSNISSYSGCIKITINNGVASYEVKVSDGKFNTGDNLVNINSVNVDSIIAGGKNYTSC